MQISTIGVDLAKHVFQVHGVDGQCKIVLIRQLRRQQIDGVLQEASVLSRWHGGMRDLPAVLAGSAAFWIDRLREGKSPPPPWSPKRYATSAVEIYRR